MELESQVAKITLGATENPEDFVYVSAEKLLPFGNECFIVAEISKSSRDPHASFEQIALSLSGAVKRVFKKGGAQENFELAVSQANQELGKLAALGQTAWVDRLNCIIGVKTDNNVFNISTTGKVSAFLIRDEQLIDLNCSSPKAHPLKTFENFASGKLRSGDILILSTPQLFNHISADKLKRLLAQGDFLKASAQVVGLLKQSAAENVAFGSILAEQVEKDSLPEEEIDLEKYIEFASPSRQSFFTRFRQFAAALLAPGKPFRPSRYEDSGLKSRLKSLRASLSRTASGARNFLNAAARYARFGGNSLKPERIRQFSPQKKFFFFSFCVLLLALILQITAAIYLKSQRESQNRIASSFLTAKKHLSDADAALLYKDEPSAKKFYFSALEALNGLPNLSKEQRAQEAEIKKQGGEIKARLEKTLIPEVQNLGALAAGSSLIRLPGHLAAQSPEFPKIEQIISFDKTANSIRDDVFKYPEIIELAEAVGKDRAVVYSGKSLRIWNYAAGSVGDELALNVPSKEDAAGLKLYPAKNRLYMLDRGKNQILSFEILGDLLVKPQVSLNLKNDEAKSAVDLAVDGSIYVLTRESVKKYHLGFPQEFKISLLQNLNNPRKIQAKIDSKYLYVLDAGNQRIVILNKQGGLVNTLTSPEFSDLADFEIDEKNKIMYLLNGSSLLKVRLP